MEPGPNINLKTSFFIVVLLALVYWKYTEDVGALKKEIAEIKEVLKYKLSNHIRVLLSEEIRTLKTDLSRILKQHSEQMAQYKDIILGILMKLNDQGQNRSGGIKHSICNYFGGYSTYVRDLCIKIFTDG